MATLISGSTGVNKITDGTIAAADFASGVRGKVLQVVSASNQRGFSFTSTDWITTQTTLAITPSSTSSKILVKYNSGLGYCDTTNASFQTFFTIFRGSTNIANNTTYGCAGGYQGGVTFGDFGWSTAFEKLDSPSSTSAVTYTIKCRQHSSSHTQVMDYRGESTITLMEIAG